MFEFRSSSARMLSALVAGATICTVGLLSTHAQVSTKSEKAEIPGGIEGHVKSVNHEKETVSIVTSDGRTRTFSITEDTTMIGPRGGKVRRRLNDRRFHEGMELTVVADGGTAKEVHLGYSRREPDESTKEKSSAKGRPSASEEGKKAPRDAGKLAKGSGTKAVAREEDDDDDDEIPGKVKSFDAARRLLVVSLLNGKSRSFLLANDVKVLVKGAASKLGLKDSALKEGASVTVLVEAGGRRVRELHVSPLPAARSRKAA